MDFAYQEYIKMSRMPTTWCSGCGLGIIFKHIALVFHKLGFNKKNTVVVSGIGCSGRTAGFFSLDTVHGLHGRALPLAEAVKAVNPGLKVVVVSGDGDILGIGGNHLIHTARRNADITVICVNNRIYGMTGGQKSPTTEVGTETLTSPEGNMDYPFDPQHLLRGFGCFYARSTTFHLKLMEKSITEALSRTGFSFVEIMSQCTTNDGRRRGYTDGYSMLEYFKNRYKIKREEGPLSPDEIGILR